MPVVRDSILTTGEVAVFDTSTGELVILQPGAAGDWNKSQKTIEEARNMADQGQGYTISKRQLKTLLLATDRVVLLT